MSAYRMSYELSKYFANKDAALNEAAKYPIKASQRILNPHISFMLGLNLKQLLELQYLVH